MMMLKNDVVKCPPSGPMMVFFLSLWSYEPRMMFNMNGSIGSPYILVR